MTSWAQNLTDFAVAQLGEQAQEALLARGVSKEQMDLYQIGYLDQDLPEDLPEHFVRWAKGGSKLDDVFVLPLTTALGEVRGFQFRHVERERSGYMDYFMDRREACLFGLKQAMESMWDCQSVYLVEGAFDLFPIQRATPNVIATLTAHTNALTIRLLRRVVTKVWVGYDMDAPGRRGCEMFEKKHGSDFEVYTVAYPSVDGETIKDPGELWEAWGDSQMVPFIRSTMANEDLYSLRR